MRGVFSKVRSMPARDPAYRPTHLLHLAGGTAGWASFAEEISVRLVGWSRSSGAGRCPTTCTRILDGNPQKEASVNLMSNAITGGITLLAVLLGGWLSIQNQNRLWQRDHARQWRDIRLSTYRDFLSAYREYIAFTLEPTANISARPHPRRAGDLMPYFDEVGRPYLEKLDATRTAVRLISELPGTGDALDVLVRRTRRIAAMRATHSAEEIPDKDWQRLWAAEHAFITAARQEVGLSGAWRTTVTTDVFLKKGP
jgi:hypothetical protein